MTPMIEFVPNLTSRLHFIKITSDWQKDIELQHCMAVFENHVYGIVSQYNRIQENIKIRTEDGDIQPPRPCSSCQAGLDIYYYTLTWDKLKEIFKIFSRLMNDMRKASGSIPINFNNDYKLIQRRINHLFAEFDKDVRDEYEHPSLKPRRTGNIVEWGSLYIDPIGNIRALVGEKKFAFVKKDHIEKLINLWISLIDIFITNFSDKRPTIELIQMKKQVEDNIDSFVEEYRQHREGHRDKEANELFHRMIMLELFLSKEGLSLDDKVRNKIYSAIWGNNHKRKEGWDD